MFMGTQPGYRLANCGWVVTQHRMVPPTFTASSEARYLALSVLFGLVTVSSLTAWL